MVLQLNFPSTIFDFESEPLNVRSNPSCPHKIVVIAANLIYFSVKFTAQATFEANYMLAVIHFFRSVTKMFYGQDWQRGAPPPLVFLSGLGEYLAFCSCSGSEYPPDSAMVLAFATHLASVLQFPARKVRRYVTALRSFCVEGGAPSLLSTMHGSLGCTEASLAANRHLPQAHHVRAGCPSRARSWPGW